MSSVFVLYLINAEVENLSVCEVVFVFYLT